MGNSESQYSIQGHKCSSLAVPGKHKPYSLRFRAAKEEVLSPHGWWRGGAVGLSIRSRAIGRGCLSQHKGCQPYVPRHYDYVTKGNKASPNGKLHRSSPELCEQGGGLLLPPENGYHYRSSDPRSSGQWDGHALNGQRTPERRSLSSLAEERRSPKVVIKKDGTLRVEFTNSTSDRRVLDDSGGPVQLLRFSPTVESTPSLPGASRTPEPPQSASSTDPTLRTSSLGSDCSWYDWPWGDGAEPGDGDPDPDPALSPGRPAERCACGQGRVGHCSCPTSLPDLYRDPAVAVTFPASRDLRARCLDARRNLHRASFVSVLDVPAEEECPEAKEYLSYTLPCRKAPPRGQSSAKKDPMRGRLRRISDWTGSLSSKKRKLQESRSKEASECFDSGVDGLTADTSSPSQASSLLWYPGAGQAPPTRSESASALHGSDALRQNIYENFMRELETGRSSGVEGQEPSTGTEDTSSDSLGSLEQLDLRFEKEQGVVRKAGWLSFKPLLTLHKDKKLELVARRKWKQYWVTLKGCTLLFYETYGKSSAEQDAAPRYALLAEDSVVQSVPEHPKKENVFCLSNSYGDVYLFQAASQTDLENWVTAIHSASASMLAKRQGKEDTVRLLRSQTRALLQKIDMDGKMKKMAELQLSIVSDPKNRRAIESQIQQWEQNLEKFHMDLFRLRCYLASLQGCEQPNPKSLLATASRPSKATLSRLGIFSVSSFHALICSRDDSKLRKHSLSLSLSQHNSSKRGLFSSLKGLDSLTKRGQDSRPVASQIFEGNDEVHLAPCSSERLDGLANLYSMASSNGTHWDACLETACVYLPDNQAVTVPLKGDQTVEDVLSLACKVGQLDPHQHGLRVRRYVGQHSELHAPASSELICNLLNDRLEILPLNVYTLHMTRPTNTADFGFAVTGYADSCRNSHVFVSEVLPDSLAYSKGLRPGDEILILNGKCVSTVDLARLQMLFGEQTLELTVKRDSVSNEPSSTRPNSQTRDSSLLVPVPNQSHLQEEFLDQHHKAWPAGVLGDLDVPASSVAPVLENGPLPGPHRRETNRNSVETVCTVYHTFQEGPGGLMEGQKGTSGAEPGMPRPCPRHMSATDRLRKVIQELVDTEKSYVKDLSCLFEIYLKPLQSETFLTQDEMESLFGSLPEMLNFQRVFLQTLEERIASSPDFSTLESPVHFKKLLFSLGGSFLYYADHFKLYSGFCANHIKVQKVLERAKTDRAFKEFLDTKNPTKQHSSTLESYLIKPVQRVLKYPLLLRELVSLTDTDSEEHYHLTEALKAMEKVASHINEMQKIYEDYGTVFDQLVAEQSDNEKEVTEISMGEFLMHSSVVWLNPFPSLGRMRKDPELTVFVFKRAVILVCRESSKLKKKMGTARSSNPHGDFDPFKFRWLIPLSALQVRLGNTAGADTSCIWELIHTKSELEGRPETTFQLCSSNPECKAKMIKVIRSVLRENARRNERASKERLAPLRSVMPTSARIGSTRASWMGKHPSLELPAPRTLPKGGREDSDESSQGGASSDGRTQRGSPTSAIEAQFQRLSVAEAGPPAPCAQPEGAEPGEDTPENQRRLVRAHFGPVKRKSSSLRRSQGALLSMREHSRSLDSQTEPPGVDINTLLEREFSVQSLASAVNEDCFYDMAESFGSATTVPTV
ncbi:T-lymphoma invasion and metastasis-inducing protein 2 [Megalops cyprinoides]|uniref:T-lymphoma invasion and metastasis-inducing protein 2 n=1 Tax=Megalops cyprinoides TaxID=118141 RepID=UPI001863D693|nr:T-lymphoma invasion and metastasis-inducing protein 2 [Megalops cyprinoides]